MKIIYFEFGQARLSYGSAAAMAFAGSETYIIDSSNILECNHDLIDVEIGVDGETKRIGLNVIKLPPQGKNGKHIRNSKLLDLLTSLDPSIIIAGPKNWILAKKYARNLGIPLIFWNPVVPSILKLPSLIYYGRVYSRIITTPFGFIYNYMFSRNSDYIMTNDLITTKIFKNMLMNNISTIWPTYARFLKQDAYKAFLENTHRSKCSYQGDDNYILSIIALRRDTPIYRIELKALSLLKKVAIELPDITFVVVGASIDDLKDKDEFNRVKNIKLLGKVYDDNQIADLYRNARGVFCPIIIPGFSNRLLEAFFYRKAIISTRIVENYYEGLIQNNNIMLGDSVTEIADTIKYTIYNDNLKINLERKAHEYYLSYFAPIKHSNSLYKHIYKYCKMKE